MALEVERELLHMCIKLEMNRARVTVDLVLIYRLLHLERDKLRVLVAVAKFEGYWEGQEILNSEVGQDVDYKPQLEVGILVYFEHNNEVFAEPNLMVIVYVLYKMREGNGFEFNWLSRWFKQVETCEFIAHTKLVKAKPPVSDLIGEFFELTVGLVDDFLAV